MVLADKKKEFPDWDLLYKENKVEEMPWYEKNLDPDLEHEISIMDSKEGYFLDLGTGPGTQAMQIAKLGFETTGSDISKNAIEKARQISCSVNFVVDNILHSLFPDNAFDFILDRGCFHTLDPTSREIYLNQIKRILKDDGTLFLKVMSKEEKGLSEEKGPYRFSRQEILDVFRKDFKVKKIESTVYYGTLDPLPKALFAVIKQELIQNQQNWKGF